MLIALSGLSQIAVWNSYKGMNLTDSRDKNNNVTDSLANRTLIVTTILVSRNIAHVPRSTLRLKFTLNILVLLSRKIRT